MSKRSSSFSISPFTTLKGVSDPVTELFEDSSKIEDIINEQMAKVVQDLHPQDYTEFMEKNKAKLEEIKKRVKKRCSSEIKSRISEFLIRTQN